MWKIFSQWWWLILPILLTPMMVWYWMEYVTGKTVKGTPWVVLSISVPKLADRSPKFAENMFTAIWSIQHGIHWVDKYWEGKMQEPVSFEIIGIEGHVRFLVRVTAYFRDHVEAQIYASYPQAEITEVEDYTQSVPDDFLEQGFDLWGTEFELVKPDAYPIRTYPAFFDRDHLITADPMAAVAEVLSNLGKGEQIWIQWLATPLPPGGDFIKEGQALVEKLIGKASKSQLRGLDNAFNFLDQQLDATLNAMHDLGAEGYMGMEAKEAEDKPLSMLTPGEVNALKAIQNSLSKHAYAVKGRLVYVGRKEVFRKPYGVTGPFGAIQLFNTSDLNGFKPKATEKTSIDFFFRDYREAYRKRKILQAYKKRHTLVGGKPFVLTTEELATVFHFPEEAVKAERIETVQAKRAAPPTDLPIVE